jgi:hypothetical protein
MGAVPTVQAAPSTVFSGEWTAIDHGDGSRMHLSVYGGTRPQIVFTDEVATTTCEGRDSSFFTGLLTGYVDGDTLDAAFVVVKCGQKTIFTRAHRFTVSWAFDDGANAADPSDDTLLDSFGDTWSRV